MCQKFRNIECETNELCKYACAWKCKNCFLKFQINVKLCHVQWIRRKKCFAVCQTYFKNSKLRTLQNNCFDANLLCLRHFILKNILDSLSQFLKNAKFVTSWMRRIRVVANLSCKRIVFCFCVSVLDVSLKFVNELANYSLINLKSRLKKDTLNEKQSPNKNKIKTRKAKNIESI